MRLAMVGLLALVLLSAGEKACAHPGSGIVTDRQGNVYFVDTGSGVWKIDRTGKLTRLQGPAYHWMAIDLDGRLANVTLPYFPSGGATVARAGSDPTLILSSDFPIAVGPDGSLVYPWYQSGDSVKIFRLDPSGKTGVVRSLPPARSEGGEMRWRNGITVAPDGSVYYTEDRAVRKITPQGEVVTIVQRFESRGCGAVSGVETELGPYFRGLAVDSVGNIFVAAAGCRSVLKISKEGETTTILRSASPWSPTGIALFGREVYVLEYTHTAGDDRREWLPRVRKIAGDGTVATIASIDRR